MEGVIAEKVFNVAFDALVGLQFLMVAASVICRTFLHIKNEIAETSMKYHLKQLDRDGAIGRHMYGAQSDASGDAK